MTPKSMGTTFNTSTNKDNSVYDFSPGAYSLRAQADTRLRVPMARKGYKMINGYTSCLSDGLSGQYVSQSAGKSASVMKHSNDSKKYHKTSDDTVRLLCDGHHGIEDTADITQKIIPSGTGISDDDPASIAKVLHGKA